MSNGDVAGSDRFVFEPADERLENLERHVETVVPARLQSPIGRIQGLPQDITQSVFCVAPRRLPFRTQARCRVAAAGRKGRVGRNRGSMRLWGLHLCSGRRRARRAAGWVDAGRVRAAAAETARWCGPSEHRRNGAAGRRVVRRRSACVRPRADRGVTTHDESGGRPSGPRPSTRSITHMWPSRQRGQSRNERPVRAP